MYHILWQQKLCSFDLSEQFMRYAVIEWELTIQHCVQDNTKSPHVTCFP